MITDDDNGDPQCSACLRPVLLGIMGAVVAVNKMTMVVAQMSDEYFSFFSSKFYSRF